LVDRLTISKTQRNGKHAAYRCPGATIAGNSDLARRLIDGKPKALIETRGEGGYVLAAPTAGYEVTQGDLNNLPIITPGERQILWEGALSLNEYVDPKKVAGQGSRIPKKARRPGDDFNERGEVASILEKHDWQPVGERGPYQYWRRPGKDEGKSASLIGGKIFYNFSSNGFPFTPGEAYSPFGVYAFLEHDGDYEAAARALVKEGYGEGVDGGRKGPTQAEILISLAGDAELFHDVNFKGYATVEADGHKETWPIRSKGFKSWLLRRYYEATGKAPGGQAWQDALGVLEAKAHFDGPELEVYVRVAHVGGHIYVDLANEAWEAVEITSAGWRIAGSPPVKFRRPRGLAPLPTPRSGDHLNELRPFVNCLEEDWPLVIAWLLGAFSPGPYPALDFQGEQGVAKSTAARVLKSLVDPGSTLLRTAPRNIQDLMIAAANSWCLSFDNLSDLKPWLSDGFCRLATGGGMAARELYSDDEECILDAMRPLLINGIDHLASRGDLADRTILLELPKIQDEDRRKENEIKAEFETARPGILGAIFDALSAVLANLHTVELARLPRMADFAVWVVAAEPVLPWEPGGFLDAYARNQRWVTEHSLEADHVAMAVRAFMEGKDLWQGTPGELLVYLEGWVSEGARRSKSWPKAANSLSNRLRRAAPALRAGGLEIEKGWSKKSRTITILRIDGNDLDNDIKKRSLPLKPAAGKDGNNGNDDNDEKPSFSVDEKNYLNFLAGRVS
jgi:hypothetical protein